LLLSSGQLRGPAGFGSYHVSVPSPSKPYDPERWAIMNAEDYAAALKIDPTLPDPNSVDYGDAAATPPRQPRAAARRGHLLAPPPKAMPFAESPALDRERAHYCLTAAIYYEAASESDDGMRGVAQTIINRFRTPELSQHRVRSRLSGVAARRRVPIHLQLAHGAMARGHRASRTGCAQAVSRRRR